MKRVITAILSILMLSAFLTGCMSEEKINEDNGAVGGYQDPIETTKVTYYRSEYDAAQYVMTLQREAHTLMIRSNMKKAYEEYISTVEKASAALWI